MSREELERYLAEGLSLEQMGKRVGRTPSTISYHLKKYGLRPLNRQRHLRRGGIPEAKLRAIHASGASLKEIANEVDRAVSTVRYWIDKYGLGPTAGGVRRAAVRRARLAGKPEIELQCRHHGNTVHVIERDGHVRCKHCRVEAVSKRRRRTKRTLVEEAGGACAICGYDRSVVALQFHHLDRTTKSFELSRKVTRSLEETRREASKCVLLCGNCHAEVEAGLVDIGPRVLPVQLAERQAS
jgi:transposase-like protein